MEDQVPEVPLVLVSNPYLEKKAAVIRQKPILWEVRWRDSLCKKNKVTKKNKNIRVMNALVCYLMNKLNSSRLLINNLPMSFNLP